MLVSRESRLAFVHVQKTGGRSVNRVLLANFPDLSSVGRRHIHFDEAVRLEPALDTFFVFGFVRNPWDRLVSWYSMIASAHETPLHARHLRDNRFWQAARADFPDFESFIRVGVGDARFRPERYRRLRIPQTRYFEDREGAFRADFVGRTERLDEDLATVMARFDVHLVDVPRVNSSAHAHYADYYSRASRDVVADVFAADVDRFGYLF